MLEIWCIGCDQSCELLLTKRMNVQRITKLLKEEISTTQRKKFRRPRWICINSNGIEKLRIQRIIEFRMPFDDEILAVWSGAEEKKGTKWRNILPEFRYWGAPWILPFTLWWSCLNIQQYFWWLKSSTIEHPKMNFKFRSLVN